MKAAEIVKKTAELRDAAPPLEKMNSYQMVLHRPVELAEDFGK
jgi:hypothetical protein